MWSWKDELTIQEQYKDMLREAEKRALVKEALRTRERRAPVVGQMLAGLVQYFSDLRCSLLEWYAFTFKVSVQTPCRDAGTEKNL